MWKNSVEYTDGIMSLHDCVVNSVERFDDILSLYFNDGFWILSDTEYNSCGATVRTYKSKIEFIDFDEDMSEFYLFKRHYLFSKHICTTRKKVDLKEVYEKINSGAWKIEFIEQYKGFRRFLFFGSLTTKKKGNFEFQVVIDCEKMECCWNNIRPDRKW
ncbi:MAG: hypothetical protein IJC78_08225 [Clostridia bacterium]|nr:hypothetical protein [Clostridia bacterium]